MGAIISLITAAHLAALSQIESGDNDKAVGRQGEVSRYQIAPRVWNEYGRPFFPFLRPTDEIGARIIAYSIWQERVDGFCLEKRREATLPELYLLWHRPGALRGGRHRKPTARELERAERFANLVRDIIIEQNKNEKSHA